MDNNQVPTTQDPTNLPSAPSAETQKPVIEPGQETTLTPEQWKLAFESPRFKELTESAKKAKQLEDKLREQEDGKLKEQQRFQELYEKEKLEKEQLQSSYKTAALQNAITLEATKLGVVDVEVVGKLINTENVEYGKDGLPTNIGDLIKELITAKPYLAGEPKAPANLGNNLNNAPANTKPKYTLSEYRKILSNYPKYLEVKSTSDKEIDNAIKEGRVLAD